MNLCSTVQGVEASQVLSGERIRLHFIVGGYRDRDSVAVIIKRMQVSVAGHGCDLGLSYHVSRGREQLCGETVVVVEKVGDEG